MSTSSVFSGSSRFSSDFAQVIQRSLDIASLPLTLIRQQKAKLDDQVSALSSLSGKVSAVSASLFALSNSFGASSFEATVTDESAVKVTTGDSATVGTWNVTVTDPGAATVFVVEGFPPVVNPASGNYTTAATQTLILDPDPTDGDPSPQVFTLSPKSQTLQALVDEINKVAGASVQASIVNVQSGSATAYKLSLQSKKLGPVDITLTDGVRSEANPASVRGAAAKYTVNGINVTSDARTVILAPGVTMALKAKTTSAVTISVGRSNTALRSALNGFIGSYNGANTDLDSHRGNKSAALSGSSVLSAAGGALRQLVGAGSDGGELKSLQEFGVVFDRSGKLYLDDAMFTKATSGTGIDSAKNFFSSTSTAGWLKSASKILESLTHSDTGIIGSAIVTTEAASKAESRHIDEQQERIDRLETDLRARMTAADAMVAMLEQQTKYFTNMFAAMKSNQDSYS